MLSVGHFMLHVFNEFNQVTRLGYHTLCHRCLVVGEDGRMENEGDQMTLDWLAGWILVVTCGFTYYSGPRFLLSRAFFAIL